MDHVIALLDADHERLVAGLSLELAGALSIDVAGAAHGPPHITLVSYTGLSPGAASRALTPVARETGPVSVRAHGYGVFTGDADTDLSLHVMVVRTRPLDELHRRTHAALAHAGARPAGTTDPAVWTPHITLLDHGLTPSLLGRAVELLAHRPHRSWTIDVTSLTVARRALGAGAVPPVAPRLTVGLG
jgi:2'-5' RNA ligase